MLDLPRLRADQLAIVEHPARVKVLSMGRRWGKTILGGVVIANVLRQHGRAAWVAPTYKNTRPMWRFLTEIMQPVALAGKADINKGERTIQTNKGGEVAFYSGDNIDSIRGEAFNLVVIDEAAKLGEGAWTDAVMPTLSDFDGDAILISTPRGRNWFFFEYLQAQADGTHAMAWQAPSTDNPLPGIQRAARLAKDRVSESTYNQEWLAQFVESGGVFRNIREVSTATPQPPQPGASYVFGIDWAFSNDFTVVSVLDIGTMTQVYLDRYNGVDYIMQRQRIEALAARYKPAAIISEVNSMGRPNNEQLRAANLPVRDFVTSNATKAEAIEHLAGLIERGQLTLLNDPVQIGELQAYEGQRTPSGLTRYGAPDGVHDDTVMALALAASGGRRTSIFL